ncbi:hypothetical protein MAR_025011 [Mya arenaria]|uniref:Uncharacterized protein n=1 Tax=Mya arenaria TaxID=6604 RepID=A0ABY7DU69_MYAAR|nr:hypothetical protein MAR_025011 [Mya arenaria]
MTNVLKDHELSKYTVHISPSLDQCQDSFRVHALPAQGRHEGAAVCGYYVHLSTGSYQLFYNRLAAPSLGYKMEGSHIRHGRQKLICIKQCPDTFIMAMFTSNMKGRLSLLILNLRVTVE